MEWRTKLGALLGAGGLLMLAASAVVAAPGGGGGGAGGGPPTYTITVTKSANPTTVPIGGGTVTYTIAVHNTGTGLFNTVVVEDGMAGCTLGAPTGDDGNAKLDAGETWSYSCDVTGVMPGAQNTATVVACHDAGPCNASHDAQASGSTTVTEGSAPPVTQPPVTQPPVTEPPVTEPPVTEPPLTEAPATEAPATETPPTNTASACACTTDPNPTNEVGGEGDEPSAPNTATATGTAGGGSSNGIMLVIALGMLLASLVLVTPAKPVRQR